VAAVAGRGAIGIVDAREEAERTRTLQVPRKKIRVSVRAIHLLLQRCNAGLIAAYQMMQMRSVR
jgi:hypothetical protein